MKRDLELVRKILLAMEAYQHGFAPEPFTVDGYDQGVIEHHVWLMEQGGLITASDKSSLQDPSATAIAESITWEGHEFLDAVRNDKVWSKLKAEMKDRGIALPFSLLQSLALKIAATLAGL